MKCPTESIEGGWPMKHNIYTVIYAAVLGSICALLLTAAGQITKPYRQANAKAEKIRNILNVLDIPFSDEITSEDLFEIFRENVSTLDKSGIEVYVFRGNESSPGTGAVAVPFAGAGLWAPIKGFLALEEDMQTICGVTFHEQEETPGLGGEIASLSFRSQFKGKKIVGPDGKAGIKIIRGGGSIAVNEVDGITGATLTCTKVETMLNEVILKIVNRDKNND